MKRLVIIFGVLAACFPNTSYSEQVVLEGYLIDRECSLGIIEQGPVAAAAHDRSCALMDLCVQSGFGVLTVAGEFVVFDEASNDKVVAAIELANKDKDYKIRVRGSRDGNEVLVAAVTIE